jgi:hypothetical protein
MLRLYVFIFFAMTSLTAYSQKKLRSLPQHSFKSGERLKYNVHYGLINGGTLVLDIKELKSVQNRVCYHIVGKGESKGAVDWFFKVRDEYETFIDTISILPLQFIRNVREGKYKKYENVIFNHSKNVVLTASDSIKIPSNAQDILSAYYYSRCIDVSKKSVGDTISIFAYLDNEVAPFHLKFTGKETIKTSKGTFKCLIFKPQLQTGRAFSEKEGMTIWISDDANHIPVRVEAKLVVGSIKMDLEDYGGLRNPFSSKVD